MKPKFFLVGLFAVLCALQFTACVEAKPDLQKAPQVTRDNFISLEYETVSDFVGFSSQTRVRGNTITIEAPPTLTSRALLLESPAGPPLSAGLSNNQLDELIRLLNKTRLPLLSRSYRDPKTTDADKEVLTLKISDADNRDRVFAIENYGKTAPLGYFQVVELLQQLRHDKFPISQINLNPLFTRDTLESVSFETFGGYAGIRSLLTIKFPPAKARFTVSISWTRKVGGRDVEQNAQLENQEADALLQVLNAADLPKLNGQKYRQPNLYDGFNETLTVTQRGGKKFVVENYGDKAPAEYYKITAYIRQLQQKHFPQQ